jgi:hypothetical protein
MKESDLEIDKEEHNAKFNYGFDRNLSKSLTSVEAEILDIKEE